MFPSEFGLEGSTPNPIVTVNWNWRGSAAYLELCFDFYFRCLTFISLKPLVSPNILVKLQNFCNFPSWLAKVPRYSGRGEEEARYLGIYIAIYMGKVTEMSVLWLSSLNQKAIYLAVESTALTLISGCWHFDLLHMFSWGTATSKIQAWLVVCIFHVH